ncbi:MAG: class II aldolase/adducin family protein [Firmicutes bacterium]|jgi:L-fuculose-phosphate aldolase|nr:class II aldolase/adducin family protein [Bacillota bacterium]
MECKLQMLQTIKSMCQENLVLGTWGNISVREDNCFWITPSGMPYTAIQTQDFVKINLQTEETEGLWKPSSEWRLHAACYQQREDCKAVIHTHSIYATAFAVAHAPIPPVVEDLVQIVGGGVDVADYALPGSPELAENTLKALGAKNAVLLANHGLIGLGRDLTEALNVCRIVEKTAQVVVAAKMLGQLQELSPADIHSMRQFYLTSYGPGLREEVK